MDGDGTTPVVDPAACPSMGTGQVKRRRWGKRPQPVMRRRRCACQPAIAQHRRGQVRRGVRQGQDAGPEPRKVTSCYPPGNLASADPSVPERCRRSHRAEPTEYIGCFHPWSPPHRTTSRSANRPDVENRCPAPGCGGKTTGSGRPNVREPRLALVGAGGDRRTALPGFERVGRRVGRDTPPE
jgi:hypothetical protein